MQSTPKRRVSVWGLAPPHRDPRRPARDHVQRPSCRLNLSRFAWHSHAEKASAPRKNPAALPVAWEPDGTVTPARSNAELYAILEKEDIAIVHRVSKSHQAAAMSDQSRTLASLRDTLLPKLLSRELSVAGGNSPEWPDSSNQRRLNP
ncbi:MAG: hypothetical protein J6386_11825 [Candidatus Synoicihabitans palmerolidicus]|nr:hypothetical protein [Candidatus Synoicihabitans palmerolidicus]